MERFLKSRYRIGEKIGENPFSFTYKGYLIGTEVPVVIKIYKRSALNSPLINKLRPKVTKIVSLDHPNIARVIDGDYGWQGFYFVREYIEGENLDEFLQRGRPNVTNAIEIMKQILSSLDITHKEGIIHGAISANNIFLVGGREVKLADFILVPAVRINPGLLAAAASIDSNYMSPEQIKGEQINTASDIYSAGIIFYQLITGSLPFNGRGLEIALKHISGEIEPPSHLSAEIPEYLDDIILKMLEKDPLQRINNAADVLDSLKGHRLVFQLPNQEFVNLIYEEDVQPFEYEEETKIKTKDMKQIKNMGSKGKKPSRFSMISLSILIAIAAGLWYAFILNFVSAR
jgi:serine/threonine-protein kinase